MVVTCHMQVEHLPTGWPAGTTHFLIGRLQGTGAPWFLTNPCCRNASTRSGSSLGKGTTWTRKCDPSEGRGTFWKAVWGLGFSCQAEKYSQLVNEPQWNLNRSWVVSVDHKQYDIKRTFSLSLTFLYRCSASSRMCFWSLTGLSSSSLNRSKSKATSCMEKEKHLF